MSYLGAAKDNEDAFVVDKVTEKAPLVLRKHIEIWKFKKNEQTDLLTVFANPATGAPHLGDSCTFMVKV
eukprot:COSAG06_NODE_253_length_19061_cov_33.083114_14_plen_69_part_00